MLRLLAETFHTYIYTAVYSQVVIYTGEWTMASRRKWKCSSFEMEAEGIRTQTLSIAIQAFYRWATAL